jgi:succinate dehydrogenase/fumarate reductase flavoprotein subunit
METSERTVGGISLTIHTCRTLVVGCGVAGLNAAERLVGLGHDDIVIAAEKTSGASSDPVSAKAAYYRMGMDWDRPDSPTAFAKTLCDGGMTHGDVAYVEGVNSIPSFLHHAGNGVPFPRDEYGTYTGTGEHGRAASAGPLTSAVMAEKAYDRVRKNRIKILNRHEVIALLVAGEGEDRAVVGALAVSLSKASNTDEALVVFNCRNVVLATGGPGALFADTIHSAHSPASYGVGIRAGAAVANLTETRYGLAFAKTLTPLAGNLQRVIPSYYSDRKGGRDQRLFLADYFHATKQIASAIFQKGEAWAFAAPQVQRLSGAILDIAVRNELAGNRRVYVNYAQNVKGEKIGQFNISQLDPEARAWLEKTNTTQFTPYDRLRHIEPETIDRLIDMKIDLREPQEVVLCSEDTFGGLAVDANWETTVPHLFAVGDVACTHGNPPDGAELNAGQVGGMRAAERIADRYAAAPMSLDAFLGAVTPQLERELANLRRYVYGPTDLPSVRNVQKQVQQRTDEHAGMIRSTGGLTQALGEARALYNSIRTDGQRLARQSEFVRALENELLCLTQIAFLENMKTYIEQGGGSRGSYLVLDEHGDAQVLTRRGSELRHRNENMGMRGQVIETVCRGGTEFTSRAVSARPIPSRPEG